VCYQIKKIKKTLVSDHNQRRPLVFVLSAVVVYLGAELTPLIRWWP